MRRVVRVLGARRVSNSRQVQRRAHTRVAVHGHHTAAHRRRQEAHRGQPAHQGLGDQQAGLVLAERERRARQDRCAREHARRRRGAVPHPGDGRRALRRQVRAQRERHSLDQRALRRHGDTRQSVSRVRRSSERRSGPRVRVRRRPEQRRDGQAVRVPHRHAERGRRRSRGHRRRTGQGRARLQGGRRGLQGQLRADHARRLSSHHQVRRRQHRRQSVQVPRDRPGVDTWWQSATAAAAAGKQASTAATSRLDSDGHARTLESGRRDGREDAECRPGLLHSAHHAKLGRVQGARQRSRHPEGLPQPEGSIHRGYSRRW